MHARADLKAAALVAETLGIWNRVYTLSLFPKDPQASLRREKPGLRLPASAHTEAVELPGTQTILAKNRGPVRIRIGFGVL